MKPGGQIARALLGGLLLSLSLSAPLCAQSGSALQCFYDELGQLTRVVDPSGNVTTYTYDAVANILQVGRSTVSSTNALSILGFSPQQGGPGQTVTIQGTGFSATATSNMVQFNGTTSAVVSASATLLVVSVPAGATTGPVSVTVAGQTATSATNFTVLATPQIISVSPQGFPTSSSSFTISNLQVTGTNLTGATFSFLPAFSPPWLTVTSALVGPSGTAATLSVNVNANVSGTFVLLATNSSGSSSQLPSSSNTIKVLNLPADSDYDADGLTNAVELAIGTDPTNPNTAGDGLRDGWDVFYHLNPLINNASTSAPDGLTYLQNFLVGHDPTNTNVAPPTVSQVYPANNATNYPTNGIIVIRFSEPLRSAVAPLTAAQNAIVAALSATNATLAPADLAAAAQTLQNWLANNGEGNSVVPGTVQLFQNGTPVAGTLAVSNDGLSVTFSPSIPLEQSTSYALVVPGVANPTRATVGVRDLAGDQIQQTFQSSFTTGLSTDITGPTIVLTNPAQGAANVPINSPIMMEFSKPIDPTSISPSNFTVTDTLLGAIGGMVQVDPTGLTASFVPSAPFAVGHQINAYISNVRDTSGNLLSTFELVFQTGFASETVGPTLVAASPASGATGVPLNAVVVLEFDQPLDVINATNGLQVQTGGTPVPGAIALSDGNKRITFTPASPLLATTVYTVATTAQITDVAGNPIATPGSFTFTTGSAPDKVAPQVALVNPSCSGACSNVPINIVVQVAFNKPIDPLTVTNTTFFVAGGSALAPIPPLPATVSVSADGQTATLLLASPLEPFTEYVIEVCGVSDLVGQQICNANLPPTFTTGAGAQTAAPTVVLVSPPNGASDVPVNASVVVQLSAPANPISVGSSAIVVSSGAGTVAGSNKLGSNGMTLTFTPSSLLAANTSYSVAVSGITDSAGNTVVPFSSTFTTSTSNVPVTAPLTLVSASPANGATGVAVSTTIILTFSAAVNPATVNTGTILVGIVPSGAPEALVAGSLAVNGATVTFTPLTQLPGGSVVPVQVSGVGDLAGNFGFATTSFTTASTADTTPPQVISVTPSNDATNVGPNTPVVLTFSKSLNPQTINSLNFGLLVQNEGVSGFVNLASSPGGVLRSSDNRTVTLSGWQPSSVITIIATSGVQDLSGNPLANFNSQFTTAPAFQTTAPGVVSQRPANGASGVPTSSGVVLFLSQPMNQATLPGAVHASQNGALVNGSVQTADNGQTVQFTPAAPFANNALVQVFLDTTAQNANGFNLQGLYEASFRTAPDPATTPPALVSASPAPGATGVPLNSVIDLGFSEPLDPSTINNNAVTLSPSVPVTVSLTGGGTVIHVVPSASLNPTTTYSYQISASINGINGLPVAPASLNTFFTTGNATASAAPTIASVSPPDGSLNVGNNASLAVRFNGPIDTLTANSTTIQVTGSGGAVVPCDFSFSNNNQNVLLVPHAVLPDNTQVAITIAGVTDLAGNAVTPQTTHFTTQTGPGLVSPIVITENPVNGATNVPLNAPIILYTNEPIDPATVNANTFLVVGGGKAVQGTYSVSSSGETISFVPSQPLTASQTYNVAFANLGMTDLDGNLLPGSNIATSLGNFTFTTGTAADNVGPQVLGVSPGNGLTAIPTNVQVVIQFDEPIDGGTVGQITLSGGGATASLTPALSNGNQFLALVPLVPLNGVTPYTLMIAGVQDMAGIPMAAPVSVTFTTAAGADLSGPPQIQSSPASGATGVLTTTVITLTFNKRIDPLSVNSATFKVTPQGSAIPIAGTVTVSGDGLSASFTPASPLAPSTTYSVFGGRFTDLVGQGNFVSFSFTTGTM